MRLSIKILISSLLLSLVGCTNLTNYEPPIYQIQFGLLQKTDADQYTVTETNSISFVSGSNNQIFGYLITPKNDHKFVYNAVVVLPNKQQIIEGKVVEEKEPASPQKFDLGEFKGKGPSTINMWLTEGDTEGIHKIQLFINGSLADSREFLIH
jgi:hypothetical protein